MHYPLLDDVTDGENGEKRRPKIIPSDSMGFTDTSASVGSLRALGDPEEKNSVKGQPLSDSPEYFHGELGDSPYKSSQQVVFSPVTTSPTHERGSSSSLRDYDAGETLSLAFGELSKPSPIETNTALRWAAFVIAYVGGISAPSVIAATFYASLTVDVEFSGDNPFIKALWYLVKAAAIVPMILATSSMQTSFSQALQYFNSKGVSGVVEDLISVKGVAEITRDVVFPFGAAFVSSMSTSYVAYNRLNGEIDSHIVEWAVVAAIISATTTNARLIKSILIANLSELFSKETHTLLTVELRKTLGNY